MNPGQLAKMDQALSELEFSFNALLSKAGVDPASRDSVGTIMALYHFIAAAEPFVVKSMSDSELFWTILEPIDYLLTTIDRDPIVTTIIKDAKHTCQ